MYKFKDSLIAMAGLLSLVGVIALLTPHIAASQGSVTGVATAKASPTPADVNVVNTPSVNVSNTAANPVQVTGSVIVSNSPTVRIDTTNPLPVRDVDNPARQPFVFFVDSPLNHWFSTAPNIILEFSVPSGKRLVIEQLSIEADLTPSASQKMRGVVRSSVGGLFHDYAFTGTDSGQDGNFEDFIASAQMRSYADSGTTVQIFVTRNDTSGGSLDKAEINLSGYLINMP